MEKGELLLVVGLLMCRISSSMMNFNWQKPSEAEKAQRMQPAREHFNFCIKFYKAQHVAVRCLLHGHFLAATSRQEFGVMNLMGLLGAIKTQRAYVQIWHDRILTSQLKGFVPNSPCIGHELNKICQGERRHVILQRAATTKNAQVHSKDLSTRICLGVAQQKQVGKAGLFTIASSDPTKPERIDIASINAEELHENDGWQHASDDVSGEQFDPEFVSKARREEIEYFHKRDVRTKVQVAECTRVIGNKPVGVRCADVSKQHDLNPKYFSRSVAKEFDRHPMPEFYVATLASECFRLGMPTAMDACARRLVSDVTSNIIICDVSRACSTIRRSDQCTSRSLTKFDGWAATRGVVASTCPCMVGLGVVQGRSSPRLLHPAKGDMTAFIDSCDYVSSGSDAALQWFAQGLGKVYECKVGVPGPEEEDENEVRVLSRTARWIGGRDGAVFYDVGSKRAGVMVNEVGVG